MSVEELFRRAERSGVDGSFTRIDESHPLGIFVGLDGGRRCILVVCPQRPHEPPAIGALHLEIRVRALGEWALTIRLERADMAGLFTRLVEDLASSTLRGPKDPGSEVIDRLTRWQRMFARGATGILEDIELRGLMAELIFLIEEAVPYAGPEEAVAAWLGPYEAPKDFAFTDCEVEVKATSRQPDVLRISSLDQLADTGVPLYLWTRVVELERRGPDPTRSASAWVRRARAVCGTSTKAAQGLEDGLRAACWEDRDEYETCIIKAGTTSCYKVQGAFPRIQRTAVLPGVVDGRYRIDVAALPEFLHPDWRDGRRGR